MARSGINYQLSQKIDTQGYATNNGKYNSTFDFDNLYIEILSNNLNKIVYTYRFDNLKILKYSLFDLDYTSDALCKMSITFCFQHYFKYHGPAAEEMKKTEEALIDHSYDFRSFVDDDYSPRMWQEKPKNDTAANVEIGSTDRSGLNEATNTAKRAMSKMFHSAGYIVNAVNPFKNDRERAEAMASQLMSEIRLGDMTNVNASQYQVYYNKLFDIAFNYLLDTDKGSKETAKDKMETSLATVFYDASHDRTLLNNK